MRRRPLLVVLAVVALAVVCGRCMGGGEPAAPPAEQAARESGAAAREVPATVPAPVVEGEIDGAGGAIDAAEVPEVLAAAEGFVQAWSDPRARPDAVAGLVTADLAAALTDPIPYPPTGPARLLLDAPRWARAGVPARGGTIVLDLVRVGGQWLVSALAWWGGSTPGGPG